MKRNNIFIWAYITSVGFCIILRLFTEYSLWTSVVSAVTVSSAFFAVEDMLRLLCSSINDSCEILEYYITKSSDLFLKNSDFYFNAGGDGFLYQKYADVVPKALKEYKEAEAFTKEWIQDIDSTKEKLLNFRKQEKKFEMFADACAFMGFLSLFCFVFLSQYISISALTQEVFTVISFMTILVTHQSKHKVLESIQREVVIIKKILQIQEDATRELEKIRIRKNSTGNDAETINQFDRNTSDMEGSNDAN